MKKFGVALFLSVSTLAVQASPAAAGTIVISGNQGLKLSPRTVEVRDLGPEVEVAFCEQQGRICVIQGYYDKAALQQLRLIYKWKMLGSLWELGKWFRDFNNKPEDRAKQMEKELTGMNPKEAYDRMKAIDYVLSTQDVYVRSYSYGTFDGVLGQVKRSLNNEPVVKQVIIKM